MLVFKIQALITIIENNAMTEQQITREQWLNSFIEESRPHFKRLANIDLPKNIRVSIGFPSTGRRGKAIGECWPEDSSKGNVWEIFISPTQFDSSRVADILTHELIHTAVPGGGHGKDFRCVAVAVGLIGKMTATDGGPEWREWADPILKKIGDIPHDELDSKRKTIKRKQGMRMLKCECADCAFVFRTTAVWIEAGPLQCPNKACSCDNVKISYKIAA